MKNEHVVFPELSYKIIGAASTVFNELGWGLKEKEYQKALALEFKNSYLHFDEQVFIPITYNNTRIGNYYADFIIEGKVLLELKVVHKLGYSQVKQVLGYLKIAGIKLGILIYFTKELKKALNIAVF
ncbi:MAG: hypothetical protein UW92_C0005G0029 [Candidatus Jorgensenbacteria bacterium GW2011_GWA2_45_13]|uniref:GTP-binding signal recognition particle n=1 Tax=Candidatus Jorgensenbacteria bacterium GW2011_GWA2_45_13 TaxID=1618662 RepID=A0A0G1L8D5_9BACT|nr:MAG: hypothetical protein UW92_C0005G0029 [Candidatus Jorgensenbacteria bacterium GW2011_GWA2_45_13]